MFGWPCLYDKRDGDDESLELTGWIWIKINELVTEGIYNIVRSILVGTYLGEVSIYHWTTQDMSTNICKPSEEITALHKPIHGNLIGFINQKINEKDKWRNCFPLKLIFCS